MLAVGHMQLEILMPLKSYLEMGDVSRCFLDGGGFKYFLCSPLFGEDFHFI